VIDRSTEPKRLHVAIAYAGVAAFAAGAFVLIRIAGEQLQPPGGITDAPLVRTGESINALLHVLLALAIVIVTARAMGALFRRIGQPPVIGEVVGGILLGPSVLGYLAPGLQAALLPPAIAPYLGIHAQLGIILYMFLVGVELDLGIIRRSGHVTVAISHASIILPFLLGSALALGLYPILGSGNVGFTVFALFIGVSLSVTAFPVLARILTDRGISRTRMGTIALACAAIDDATAWCLLALVVSAATARATDALWTILLTVVFIAAVIGVAMPIVHRLVPRLDRSAQLSRPALSIVFVALLASAVTTEYIGIHGLFGAFLFGAIIPNRSRLAVDLRERLDDIVAILFLPAFFAFTGMRTSIGLVSGVSEWLICALIIAVACLGKFGGTVIASRFAGIEWRDAAALGVLMNTRGLVELIVLNIGLDLGILTPKLFAMLVIMALVTTMMTSPILAALLRRQPWQELAPAASAG
jgi:Kef-type K+ transport system membrane component KefB